MFWYLILVVVFLWIVVSRWNIRHAIKLSKQLKSDIKPIPVLGHATHGIGNDEVQMKTIQTFGREANKHGGLTYIWIINLLGVIVSDPEVIDVISKRCLKKHYIMNVFDTLFGNGSLIAPVPIWRHRRKVTSRTFRQAILNQFVNQIFSQQSVVMAEQLREVDGKGPFALWNYVNAYALHSVFEAIFGVQLEKQNSSDQSFAKAFEKCCELIAGRALRPWLYNSAIYKLLPEYTICAKNAKWIHNFIDQIIKSKRRQMELTVEENKHRSHIENFTIGNDNLNRNKLKPFLECLLEPGEGERPFTDLECREELLTLAVAATDTSAVGASFTAIMLSRHPDVQEKAYQELLEVFGESDRPVEAEDLLQLSYLQAVIKESLRLYPPVPLVIRTIEEDVTLPSGLTLVKGIAVIIHIWATHRNPRFWGEDADVFRPERFLEAPLKHPAAFIPFSFGPRNCLGHKYSMMSMTTTLATLLRRYQLLPAQPACEKTSTDIPELKDRPFRLKFGIMMKDVEGFKVQIKSRV